MPSAVCHLGDRRFAVGETLGLTDCKIECRCMTPPELTCIQFRSCELAQETAAERGESWMHYCHVLFLVCLLIIREYAGCCNSVIWHQNRTDVLTIDKVK